MAKKTYGGSTTDTKFSITDFIKTMAYLGSNSSKTEINRVNMVNNYSTQINNMLKGTTNNMNIEELGRIREGIAKRFGGTSSDGSMTYETVSKIKDYPEAYQGMQYNLNQLDEKINNISSYYVSKKDLQDSDSKGLQVWSSYLGAEGDEEKTRTSNMVMEHLVSMHEKRNNFANLYQNELSIDGTGQTLIAQSKSINDKQIEFLNMSKSASIYANRSMNDDFLNAITTSYQTDDDSAIKKYYQDENKEVNDGINVLVNSVTSGGKNSKLSQYNTAHNVVSHFASGNTTPYVTWIEGADGTSIQGPEITLEEEGEWVAKLQDLQLDMLDKKKIAKDKYNYDMDYTLPFPKFAGGINIDPNNNDDKSEDADGEEFYGMGSGVAWGLSGGTEGVDITSLNTDNITKTSLYNTVKKFEAGNRTKNHNQWGAHIWTPELADGYGATKGDSFQARDSNGRMQTYNTAKYDNEESGDKASTYIVDKLWSKSDGDLNKFFAMYQFGEDYKNIESSYNEIKGQTFTDDEQEATYNKYLTITNSVNDVTSQIGSRNFDLFAVNRGQKGNDNNEKTGFFSEQEVDFSKDVNQTIKDNLTTFVNNGSMDASEHRMFITKMSDNHVIAEKLRKLENTRAVWRDKKLPKTEATSNWDKQIKEYKNQIKNNDDSIREIYDYRKSIRSVANKMKFMPNIVKNDGYYDFIYGTEMGASKFNPFNRSSSWEDREFENKNEEYWAEESGSLK